MSEKRRILMLMTQLGYGGAETSFIRLANTLAQTMEVTVALFTPTYGTHDYAQGHVPLNARVVLLDAAGTTGRVARWVNRVRRVRALKRTHDFTISFLSGPNLVNALSGMRARSCVSVRGSRVYDPVAAVWQRWVFRRLLDPITYSRAGYVVPVSPGLKHEFGKQAAVVRPIPAFIDEAALRAALAAPAPAPYAALKGQPVMVAAGRLSVEKGFQHLIRVFAALSSRLPGAKLLLVGDGPMQHALREQCRSYGIATDDVSPGTASVIFAGYQAQVMPFMALGRVFVLSSSTEGFPSVLLEAMVAGVPVVAADAPWGARAILREYVEGEASPYPTQQVCPTEYGTLMPRIDAPQFEQAWVQCLFAQLSAVSPPLPRAAARARDFSLEVVSAQWQALIEEALASPQAFAEPHAAVPLLLRRVVNRLVRPLGINPFPRGFHYALDDRDRSDAFDHIHDANAWGSEESKSGVGSELATTARYREGLATLIRTRGLGSMFDAPCGDLRWMPELLRAQAIDYRGGDISASVVASVRARLPAIDIRQFDITRDAFPKVDVWHCRDCLFHLPFADIRAALNNFVRSEIPYALLTTHRARLLHLNLDLPGIGFRFLDLERPPISLPAPLAYVPDFKAGHDFPRYVGLWTRAMIRDALQRNRWLA